METKNYKMSMIPQDVKLTKFENNEKDDDFVPKYFVIK